MNIQKREGYTEPFNIEKVITAIHKTFEETKTPVSSDTLNSIASEIESYYSNIDASPTVEEVQDMIEDSLLRRGYTKEAKAFIKYRHERTRIREKGWEMDELQTAIWSNKYRFDHETFDQWIERVSGGNKVIAKLIRQKKFIFAGRILAHRGLQKYGKKVTYSNCYVMTPPEDNIESIYDTAKQLARTYSYGGGCGVDLSNLRPRGMTVNNSALTTSGAVSFMPTYDLTTATIGQNGRRGALMMSLRVSHPDIEEFINVKTKDGAITKANISIRVDDAFMKAVENGEMYELYWDDEKGKRYSKMIDARELYRQNVQNNWDWAEAGFLFWDAIEKRHLMAYHPLHKFAGTNPCAKHFGSR